MIGSGVPGVDIRGNCDSVVFIQLEADVHCNDILGHRQLVRLRVTGDLAGLDSAFAVYVDFNLTFLPPGIVQQGQVVCSGLHIFKMKNPFRIRGGSPGVAV